MQNVLVPLVAFACLAGSVAAGANGRVRAAWWPTLDASAGVLRALAVGLVGLAIAALGVLTLNTRAEFRAAEAQLALFAGDVGALDGALRAGGADGAEARVLLFRYAEGMSRALYVGRAMAVPADPQPLEDVRQALGRAVEGLRGGPGDAALAAGRFETVTRSAAGLLATVPPPGVKMCRPILVGWLMAGLGLMALLVGPRTRAALGLLGLAGMLALGMFYLEEVASPFTGSIVVSATVLDDVLHAISE